MRKQQKISFFALFLAVPILPLIFVFFPTGATALSPSAYLGNALNFAVLANTPSVTNTGTTTISGTAGNDVGIAPAASFTGAGSVTMTGGTVHLNDTAAQNAQVALTAALINLNADTSTATLAPELGGTILTSGVYSEASGTFGITGTLTLNGGGDPASLFIFRASSTLITASSSSVVLTNGALSCNVYWTVGSSATLGTDSVFVGHLLAATSITANTRANITGQLLARDAAVTLDSNVITNNNCATSTPTPTPTATSTATASATPAPPCTSTIRTLVFTSGGPGATTGKLTWVTSGPGLFQFVGDPALYPAPYNYGTLTSSWDGSLVNMVPASIYQVAVRFTAECGLVSQGSTVATNAAAVATPTPTPTVSATPTPTPVETPTPTPTFVVSETPTPTTTPIPTTTAKSILPAIPTLFAPNNDNISITPNSGMSGPAQSLRISIVNLNVGQKITVTMRRVK